MNNTSENTSKRKKEHLELCLTDEVSFKTKSNGFEHYEFKHYAITEVEKNKVKFDSRFFNKKIKFPFLISCMTGGTPEADNINSQLAIVAEELGIPVGVGSQRQALENEMYANSFKIIRKNAQNIPVLSNIGAAQVVHFNNIHPLQKIIDMIEADALVIHVNPLQELLQREGEINFKGLLKKIETVCSKITIPVIIKEVGAGISYEAAKRLLEVGVKGIDVAGAGGTSWAGVEILRNRENKNDYLWDWGLPTSYCIKEVSKLKKKYKFLLIGSGGINNGLDAAKAYALGADIVASARFILQTLDKGGLESTINYIKHLFNEVRNIMFLTGAYKIEELRKNKLFRKADLI